MKLVSSVRSLVADVCDSIVGDSDVVARVALTVHELLENTLKYSSDGLAAIDVMVGGETGARTLTIALTNRAAPAELDDLARRLDALAAADDPWQTYLRMMKESALDERRSGLGLIRIRAEGEMKLSYSVRNDVVTITASTAVN